MSRAATAPRRSSKSGAKGYAVDRAVGLLLMVGDVLGLYLGGVFVRHGGKPLGVHLPMTALGLFLLALAAVSFVVHVGVFRSRRVAFVAAAFLSIPSLMGMQGGHFAFGSGLFVLVYAILRLIPAFGPKPR